MSLSERFKPRPPLQLTGNSETDVFGELGERLFKTAIHFVKNNPQAERPNNRTTLGYGLATDFPLIIDLMMPEFRFDQPDITLTSFDRSDPFSLRLDILRHSPPWVRAHPQSLTCYTMYQLNEFENIIRTARPISQDLYQAYLAVANAKL